MKKILVFAPKSPHTGKFIEMIDGKVDYILVAGNTNLTVGFNKNYTTVNQSSIKGILTIIKNLWFTRHDYVHVHTINFTALIVSIFARKPIIVTAWGSDVLLVPKRSKIHRMITKFVLWRAKVISANSSLSMKEAISELTAKPVKAIHFGVSKFCKRTRFKDKENIIYSPRGHADLYRIDMVIESFRIFSKDNPEWQLVISGMQDAINTPKLKKQARGLNVKFTGWVSQKENAKWMSRAKIMISIPDSDALSVTVMEAIYSNCICYVSNLPSNKEVITRGLNGFVGSVWLRNEELICYYRCIDLSTYVTIDEDSMLAHNKKLSAKWTFKHNQKMFLDLYK